MHVRYKAIQMGDLAAEQRAVTLATTLEDCELIDVSEWCCDGAREAFEYRLIVFGETLHTRNPQMNIVGEDGLRTSFRFCPWCAAPVVLECVKMVRLRKRETTIPARTQTEWVEEDVA